MKNLLSCLITLVKGRHSILNKLGREREREQEKGGIIFHYLLGCMLNFEGHSRWLVSVMLLMLSLQFMLH